MAVKMNNVARTTGRVLLPLLVCLSCLGNATAGTIDESLLTVITKSPADTLVSVVIRPTGTLKTADLKADVISRFPTRAEQHREIVTALIEASQVSQTKVLDALKTDDFGSGIQNARGYWIDNVITAEMSPTAMTKLALRDDIESIQLLPDMTLVTPLSAGQIENTSPSTNPNHIRAIKADSVWKAGFTGKGRLVGSLDTGVEGKHNMLSPKWRGHNGGTVEESWHNPIGLDTVPRIFGGGGVTHGTQVMGLMVGVFGNIDTIGVCPDCQWISAAAIDIPCPGNQYASCGNLFDALQWIAEPDGDPNTDWDVPDAVANPWGGVTREVFESCQPTGIGCNTIFWNAIDNIEAGGTLMIFAAGNEGQCGPMSIRNPADRTSTETNTFSVGMVDARLDILNPPIDPLSSRGPSGCVGSGIKPELVAPGVYLRTTVPPNGVSANAYGTSFVTPLVAAGAALLREYNPNATVDEIKLALLAGAKDLGAIGPDNDYGHGMLDLMEALRNLPSNTEPAIYIQHDEYDPPPPGSSAEVVLTLRNTGTPATGISVVISTSDSRLTIDDGAAAFGDLTASGDSANNGSDPFLVTVDKSCLSGERIPLDIFISADGGYSRHIGGTIFVGPAGGPSLFTHDAGNFRITVGADGRFGHLLNGGFDPLPGGIGYLYSTDPTQSLFEGAVLIGSSPSRISDNVRDESGVSSIDLRTSRGGEMIVAEPGVHATEETRSAFDDSKSENPMGLFIEQRSMASENPDDADYLIVEYSIFNRSAEDIEEVYCGLFFDWDFPMTGTQANPPAEHYGGGFDPGTGVGWMRHRDENRLRGVCIVSETPLSGYKYFDNFTDIYNGFTETEKWQAMTGGTAHAVPIATGDGSHLIASGPIHLGLDISEKVAFAIIGGTSEAALIQSAAAARARYAAIQNSLAVDFMPGVCPNVLSLNEPIAIVGPRPAKAIPTPPVVEMAILGQEDLSVESIDPTSVTILGLYPADWRIADVGSPLSSRESTCDCPLSIPDGKADLVLSYNRSGLIAALDGEVGNYQLTVRAADAAKSMFAGLECVRLSDDPVPGRVTRGYSKARLGANSPNPFNASTIVNFNLSNADHARLEVYDILGRHVQTLLDRDLTAGEHTAVWDSHDKNGVAVASGIYMTLLTVGGETHSQKMVLLK